MEPIVIIGSGLAGYTVAREFRKLDRETSLTILTQDDGRFYSKPMLSNALAQGKSPDSLAMMDAAGMAKQLDAEIRTAVRVSQIETTPRRVLADGQDVAYGKLVLALGADAIRVPLAGDAAEVVMSVNDLVDYGRFHTAIEGAERVLIMGAGLIGCEFANDLRSAGIAVDVVDPSPWPLGRLLPEEAGRAIQVGLEQVGVNWHLDTVVKRLERDGAKYRATLDDDTVLVVDVVLSAVGLRPRTDLAALAGLKVERGICVDRHLQSSVAGIYAIGDCAEVEGLVLPYVMPIMQAARALAKTLAGELTAVTYPAMPVVVKTPAYPVVVSPPAPSAEGDWHIESTDGGVSALFRDGTGKLLGFALTGSATAGKQALTRDLPALLP